MRNLIRLTPPLAAALLLAACDVRLHDTTPAEYPANHDIGMYEVSATLTRGQLVPAGSVFVFALGDKQKITLSANADGSEWHGLYPVRCQSSFPLQFMAEWKRALDVAQARVPPQPRQVKLIEPPLTRAASFEADGKAPPKGGWQGAVQYRFVTMPSVRITAAHVEPSTAEPADAAAARAISVVTDLPVVAGCGDLTEIRLASTSAKAHGTLVIDTDHPAVPHWQTKVEFVPK
jgi:hypothetical protein